jgi:hypothetical protein
VPNEQRFTVVPTRLVDGSTKVYGVRDQRYGEFVAIYLDGNQSIAQKLADLLNRDPELPLTGAVVRNAD